MDLFENTFFYFGLLILKVVIQFFLWNLLMVDLCPCCFCKLLGFVSMYFVGFYGLYHALQPLCFVAITSS